VVEGVNSRTFVNATMYPHPGEQLKKKKITVSEKQRQETISNSLRALHDTTLI
jgi:hypothetical protein